MSKTEVIRNTVLDDKFFELAAWIGRRQAFSLVASRCSAADVECLRAIRERKLYKVKTATWGEFCERYVGFSKTYADRLISNLEEFGPNYFHISQMTRISAESYRAISGAVREDGIEFGGGRIPIDPEHSQQVVEAVNNLCKTAEGTKAKPEKAAAKPEPAAPLAPLTAQQRMDQMR